MDYFLHCLVEIGIYLVLALSLNLINGYAGLFSLGHHGFWMVGAYAFTAVVVYLHHYWPGLPIVLVFTAGLLSAAGVTLISGLVIGLPCLRLRGDYLAIATLGFAEIVGTVIINIDRLGGATGFPILGGPGWPEVGVIFRPRTRGVLGLPGAVERELFYLAVTWFLVIFTIVFIRNLMRSTHGRAIISLREDELASSLVGVNVTRYKLLVFIIGSIFAGVAGGIFAAHRCSISVDVFKLEEGILLLLIVVLGGMGSISGTVVATFLIYSLRELLKIGKSVDFLGPTFQEWARLASHWWLVTYALLLAVLMLAAPRGITGGREIDLKRLLPWSRRPGRRTSPPPTPE